MSTQDILIENLDLHPRFISVLRKAKLLTAKSILVLSVPELQNETELSKQEVGSLLSIVAHAILRPPVFVSAFQLNSSECPSSYHLQRLSVGCPILNHFLHGGILLDQVTEISGESASGKTQLCLQLAIHAQLCTGGINRNVAYICTEDIFPMKRLHQMIELLKKEGSHLLEETNVMDNIHIAQIGDLPNLWDCIKKMLPPLLHVKNVKLVIIDSIAALFRCEYELNQTVQRSKDLQKLGIILRKLATRYKAAVVCVNQVTDVLNSESCNLGRKTIPALGLTWSNLVHTRLMLSHTNKSLQKKEADSVVTRRVRSMEIVFAPHLPSSTCHFIIRAEGVQGLNSSDLNDNSFQNI